MRVITYYSPFVVPAPAPRPELGFFGDRPFFLYWQSWALWLGALGVGLALGILW